jgi:hypothetical protein
VKKGATRATLRFIGLVFRLLPVATRLFFALLGSYRSSYRKLLLEFSREFNKIVPLYFQILTPFEKILTPFEKIRTPF